MTITLFDVSGSLGAVLIVGTYLLLQFDRIDAKCALYSALNALGAALIIVSLIDRFNHSAFIVEAFWLAVSIAGLVRARSRSRDLGGELDEAETPDE